jgi:hypothetical protein
LSATAAFAYRYFMTTLDYLFRAQLGREHKSSGLREAQAISAHAAYAIAELNDPKSAVTALEQSCALFLADRLERDRVDRERLADLGHAARQS